MKTSTKVALALVGALGIAGAGAAVSHAQGGPPWAERGWGGGGGGWGGGGGGGGGWGRGGEGRGEGWGRGEGGPGMRGGMGGGMRGGMGGEMMFERGFEFFDRNFDGAVDLNEFRMILGQRFGRLDANNDGAISKDDIVTRVNEARERYGRARVGPTANLNAEQVAERFLSNFGKGADGRVTREEFAARFEPIFRLADRTGQGRVTREDIRALGVTMRMLRL